MGKKVTKKSKRHQCLSAWSFFSWVNEALRGEADGKLSPVPFGVELLQLHFGH